MESQGRKRLSPAARRSDICETGLTSGLSSVEELSMRYGVTPSTIRRDLAQLEAQGLLARTYGGAIALEGQGETSLQHRQGEAGAAKLAISAWAAAVVRAGDHVYLDGGSTVGVLARTLRRRTPLHVTSVGLNVLRDLSGADGLDLNSPGGHLRPFSESFVGPTAEAAVERSTFDAVFFGADGVTADFGICEAEVEQTRLKEIVASRAGAVYVLADSSKLGRRPFHAWARFALPWTLVTDSVSGYEEIERLREAGVDVVVVDVDRGQQRAAASADQTG
ncbi:DeoR/GlpR family DNA-binding transcription regulator [Nesterenkonia halophila]